MVIMNKKWLCGQLSWACAVSISLFVFSGLNVVAADELVRGIGLVHVIKPDQKSVNLTHDPIPEIGWPAMTMDLGLSESARAQVSQVMPGMVIEFTLERDQDGIFQIGDIQIAPEGTTVDAAKNQEDAPGSIDHDTMDHEMMDHDAMDHEMMDHDAMDHGEHGHNMTLDDEGMVMNANHDRLPEDCSVISEDREFKIQVGRRYTAGRPGVIYGYSEHEIHVEPCSRVTVELINGDSVRHQWMVHGLPRYLYPQGMFHLEASGGAAKTGTFIVPSDNHTYLIHCDMAQHMEKGLKGQLVVGSGNGNLSSIPGVSGAMRPNAEREESNVWNEAMLYFLGTSALGGVIVIFTGVGKPS